ncbi:hypothetical protein VHUM_03954 [Vanrija humicola]|uniref:RINT-1 family protein n=1 Tax=Vanrija humicola TaxID=5417 RepID=A0A7D8V2L3_VANHU|nr:hypothetical protein VHUM_03954 [Vanrija humicola]
MTTIAGPSSHTTPAALSAHIRALAAPVDEKRVRDEVKAYLDAAYPDLASLTGVPGPRRTLEEDMAHWAWAAEGAATRLADAEAALPGAIEAARTALTALQANAQDLALERYRLSDESAALLARLSSAAPLADDEGDGAARPPTLLEQVEDAQAGLGRTRAALAWSRVLERVLRLRDAVLDPANHTPSALAALPHYRALSAAIAALEKVLPPGLSLLGTLADVRADAWAQLKRVLSDALLSAAEPLGWPRRVEYAAVPADKRRAFERAYTELLHFQAEGESLHATPDKLPSWTSGDGLYPIQALTEPITLRFKYHFQGSRSTNRVDKPEWAFANIQDAVYEHAGFIADYLQPLTARGGYPAVDVKCELTMLLFPTLLAFLRTRIPHLLSHPALLAHTVYQTVMFDDAVREGGFELARTSVYAGAEAEWEGLAGVVLREHDWFEQWLEGERKFAESSLNTIISAPNAWNIATDDDDGEDADAALPSTESSRQVKAMIEGITDRYAPLPAQEYRVAFLRTIQLPTLAAYYSRVSGSLDAFETLSSAFVRAVPGALGARPTPDSRVTAGTAGLERLIKAHVSAEYLVAALRSWSNDVLFAEMSADLAGDDAAPSVWDPTAQRYTDLRARAEDMMVRLITSEVEADLKQHLTRRWDVGADGAAPEDAGPDASLVAALAGYTSLLSGLRVLPRTPAARVYRRVSAHLVNHIAQRAVYAGWSKFTAAGGRVLSSEVDDWRHAAAAGVARIAPPIPTDGPWIRLQEMATLLALPSEAEAEADTPTFAQAMAAAWSGGAALDSLRERAGVHELTQDELQAVLRRRIECWR